MSIGSVLLFACHGPASEVRELDPGAYDIRLVTLEDVFLARELTVTGPEPVGIEVVLAGDGVHRRVERAPAASHAVPIVGLHAETSYTVEVTLVPEEGDPAVVTLPLDTLPLPDGLPNLEVHTAREGREPGHILTAANVHSADDAWVMVLDEDLRPVWLLHDDERWLDLRRHDERLVAVVGYHAEERDLMGRVVRSWGADLPYAALHHEAAPQPDGSILLLAHDSADIDAYPVSYDTPDVFAPATLRDDVILLVGPDGTVTRSARASELLDTTRIGYDSLDENTLGYDFAHANAAQILPDGGVLFSARHQDAVVRLDPDWQVRWILSDPAGFSAPFEPLVLTPDPSVDPLHHQHAARLVGDVLYVFDNGGNLARPGEPAQPGPYVSRVRALEIDEATGSWTELWSWATPHAHHSGAMGDADPLPVTGHVQGVWGYIEVEGGVHNLDRGRSPYSARIVELQPGEPEPWLDLEIWDELASSEDGWWVYRAERVAPITEWVDGPR